MRFRTSEYGTPVTQEISWLNSYRAVVIYKFYSTRNMSTERDGSAKSHIMWFG